MHQHLFELSISPIPETERVDQYSFETGDIPHADWWQDEENRLKAIDNLALWLGNYVTVNKKDETITFRPGFKQAWTRNKFEIVKTLVREIAQMSEEEFTNNGASAIANLKWTVDDDFGTYIYSHEDMYSMTIDQFIRETDLDNTTWYIGGIIDWHY